MLYVTGAKYVGEYKIWIDFSNGDSGVADLESDLWGPMFEPLRDLERFKKFGVSDVLHTLVWENGADLAPEHLHEKASAQGQMGNEKTRRATERPRPSSTGKRP